MTDLHARAARARQLLAARPPEPAYDLIERAADELNARRAQREPRRRSYGPPPRCGACHKFTRGHHVPCASCGYTPGQGFAA